MSNWISVENGLPNHLDEVLALSKKNIAVCIFLNQEQVNKKLKDAGFIKNEDDGVELPYVFCSKEVVGNVLNNVTHWIPLPEPPK